MSPKCKEHKKGERQAVHMHYLPFGTRLNKGILMVTQLTLGFQHLCELRKKYTREDSNPRRMAPEAIALSTELRVHAVLSAPYIIL